MIARATEKLSMLEINRKRDDVSWGGYLRHGIGTRLATLGERWGQPWLVYNPLIFAQYHALARENAPGVIGSLNELFPHTRRLADIGAGTGAFSAEAKRRGFTVMACEHSRVGRWFARIGGIRAHSFDLSRGDPIHWGDHRQGDRRPDLAICLEVGEHLSPELGDRLVRLLSELSSTIVFSAAPRGQGGIAHINEQPREYWIRRFEDSSLQFRGDLTEELSRRFATHGVAQFLIDNVMVLQKAPSDPGSQLHGC